MRTAAASAHHQMQQSLEDGRLGDATETEDRRPPHLDRAVVTESQKHLRQQPLVGRLRGRQQFDAPAHGQGAHGRVVLLLQRLNVADALGSGQAAVKLLLQTKQLVERVRSPSRRWARLV